MPATQNQKNRRRTLGNEAQVERTSRRRIQDEEEDEDEDDIEESDDEDRMDVDRQGDDNISALSKTLVRYALSNEHARRPIRREGIKNDVLGLNNSRRFKEVFNRAQDELRHWFGMELVELPVKEREQQTTAERRKKIKAGTQQKSSNTYILKYRTPAKYLQAPIIAPAKAPTAELESSYVGFYHVVIALITLSGGQLTQAKLERFLARLNAKEYTPMGRTAEVLDKMRRQGYVERVVTKDASQDDQISWTVASRGREEVTPNVLANMIREIWGPNKPPEFEQKLAASLGVKPEAQGENGQSKASDANGRPDAQENGMSQEEDEDDE